MSTGSTSAASLLAQAAVPPAQLQAGVAPQTNQPAAASGQPAATAGAQQAQQGAAQAQPQAEPFNAKALVLPDDPTTDDVLTSLSEAMADPTINQSSAQKLYGLHEQLLNAQKQMIQAFVR